MTSEETERAVHKIQPDILHRKARGEAIPFSILLVHALDLLLLAWAEIDYAEPFIKLHRRIAQLEASQ